MGAMPSHNLRLLREAANRLFSAEDTVSLERAQLITEAYAAHQNEPLPIRRALAFSHLLSNMELDVDSNPLFAGNTSPAPRAWILMPEYGFEEDIQVGIEHAELKGFLEGKIPDDLRRFWARGSANASYGGTSGIGHLAVDLWAVVHRGLDGLIAEAQQAAGDDASKGTYRRGMVLAMQAVVAWAERYAAAAERAAERTADPARAGAHRRVASACRRVPRRPARDLFEGLQAIALVHLAIALEGHGLSVSMGLPDRVLAPFAPCAEADPGGAAELVAGFLLKLASHSLFGRGSKTQAITVGGADCRGNDGCNALTRAFLAAYELVPVADPHLFLRWHRGLDADIWRRALDMLAHGRSMPLLVNDVPTVAGFLEAGISPEDAWEYCVIGCNELGIPGRLWDSAASIAGGMNFLEVVNEAMVECLSEGMPALAHRIEQGIRQRIRHSCLHRAEEQRAMARQVPTPFTSALMRGATERGCDLLEGMPYRHPGWFERGLSNAANALAVAEALDDPHSLLTALEGNHSDEALRLRMARQPGWGTGAEPPRRWLLWLLEARTRIMREVEARTGSDRHVSCHVVRSLHHVDGARIGASADGRRAGEPVADSIGAVPGPSVPGPTALLLDVLSIDTARHYPGGTNLNLTLPLGASVEAIDLLATRFLDGGGQELQINCLDAARLRAARREPEAHRDLVVRVAGLSARFVELSDAEQEELIRRAEAQAVG